MSHPALALVLVTCMALLVGAAHADSSHRFVRITSGGLQPATLHLSPGERIGWVNYSSHIARVSFEREVARQLVCTEEGSFRMTGARLESKGIQATQFASLCELAPGSYVYRVDLHAGAGSGAGQQRSLEGRVVVH
jgi:plastocyanin